MYIYIYYPFMDPPTSRISMARVWRSSCLCGSRGVRCVRTPGVLPVKLTEKWPEKPTKTRWRCENSIEKPRKTRRRMWKLLENSRIIWDKTISGLTIDQSAENGQPLYDWYLSSAMFTKARLCPSQEMFVLADLAFLCLNGCMYAQQQARWDIAEFVRLRLQDG